MPEEIDHGQHTSYVGQSVVIPCNPKLKKDVDWKYKPNEMGFEDYIYSNGHMYSRFNDSMTVVKSNDSDYDLFIRNVSLGDTGIYKCIEDLGFGTRHINRLLVSDSGKLFSYLFTVLSVKVG